MRHHTKFQCRVYSKEIQMEKNVWKKKISTNPIVWWHTFSIDRFAFVPDVVIFEFRITVHWFDEPFRFVTRVIWHKVQNDLDAQCVGFAEQFFQIFICAEDWVDWVEIGDVIAKIDHWRFEAGTQPSAANAQLLQMIQFRDDTLNIADAIAVAVLERAWVNLIKDGVLPPFQFWAMLCCDELVNHVLLRWWRHHAASHCRGKHYQQNEFHFCFSL